MAPSGGDRSASAMAWVHPSAEVDDDVVIGAGSRVWAGSHLRRGARIGEDCVVGEHVLVDLDVHVGAKCKLQAHALLFRGASLGTGVFLGPGVCLTNDRRPRSTTPEGALKSADDWECVGVAIEDGASLGAHTVVLAGARVGRWAMVGAGAVVTADVPSHAMLVGNPARRIGWVCCCGQPLDDRLSCPTCRRRYRVDGLGLREDTI